MFLFGGTVGALTYHIVDAAERLKEEYAAEIAEYKSNKDFMIKNDVSHFTQEEIERLENETRSYLDDQINMDYQNSLNEKTVEIIEMTDKKIRELKQYIDELLNAE